MCIKCFKVNNINILYDRQNLSFLPHEPNILKNYEKLEYMKYVIFTFFVSEISCRQKAVVRSTTHWVSNKRCHLTF